MSDNNDNVNPHGVQLPTTPKEISFTDSDFMDTTVRKDIDLLQHALEDQHLVVNSAAQRITDLGTDVTEIWRTLASMATATAE